MCHTAKIFFFFLRKLLQQGMRYELQWLQYTVLPDTSLAYGTNENVNLEHWLSLPRGKVHLSKWPVG